MTSRPAATIALACLLAACGDDGTGTADGPAYDITFTGEIGGTMMLMRTRGEARDVRRIGLGYPGIGAVSDPAGTRVVYTTLGNADVPPRLMVLDGVGDEPRALTTEIGVYEREADWSPLGDRIAFTSLRDEGFGDVFVARVAGSVYLGATNLTGANGGAASADMTPAWSPDGARIAWTSYRSGSPSIWVMNADGTEPRRLTTPANAADYFPTWSPAGDSIAFQRMDETGSRIGLVAAAGGTPRFLALAGDAFSPQWAPDAARLAIAMRDETADLDIYVVGTDGTVKERIPRAGRDYQPRWLRSTSRF